MLDLQKQEKFLRTLFKGANQKFIMQNRKIILEGLMNKWNTIKSLIENKDFEGLQGILHDEYLYLRETTLISKSEMVDFIKKRFEDGLTFEKLELIIEDKDLLAWRDILLEHGGKRWETTNVQLWKDKKVWRDIVSVRDLEKEEPISNS